MFDFEYIGNLHIHTRHSDGAGSVPEIAAVARKVGLDFICTNDHDYDSAFLHLEDEGFYGPLLVLIGLEIGEQHHHYLAYDLDRLVRGRDRSPQQVIDEVTERGGFGFLAHPFEKGMPFAENSRAYTWDDLSVTGFTGICLWNFTSRWKERVTGPFQGLLFLALKHQLLKGPSRRTLRIWDELCRDRQVVAIGGSDAHGTVFQWRGLRLRPFSYRDLLRSVNVHIFLGRRMPAEFKEARKEVYAALEAGRLFVAHDGLCPAKGFRFDYVSDGGSNLFMGEEDRFSPGSLLVELPRPGEIRLIRDGRVAGTWRGAEASYRVREPGVYRVEVCRKAFPFGWRPWIFSNPIYLR